MTPAEAVRRSWAQARGPVPLPTTVAQCRKHAGYSSGYATRIDGRHGVAVAFWGDKVIVSVTDHGERPDPYADKPVTHVEWTHREFLDAMGAELQQEMPT